MDKTKGLFLPEDENLREKGDWSQFTLWQQGELLTSRLFSTASHLSEVDPSLVTLPRAGVPQFTGNCPEKIMIIKFHSLFFKTTCEHLFVCVLVNRCVRVCVYSHMYLHQHM